MVCPDRWYACSCERYAEIWNAVDSNPGCSCLGSNFASIYSILLAEMAILDKLLQEYLVSIYMLYKHSLCDMNNVYNKSIT